MPKFLVTVTTTHVFDEDDGVNTPEEAEKEARLDAELGIHETIDVQVEEQSEPLSPFRQALRGTKL